MNIIAKTTVPNFTTLAIAEYAVTAFASRHLLNPEPHYTLTRIKRGYCASNLAVPPYDIVSLLLQFPKQDTLQLISVAPYATQSILINIKTGKMQYCYTGTREKMPGCPIKDLLDSAWDSVNSSAKWKLTKVTTTHRKWAIELPLLSGRFGKGVANRAEQEIIDNRVKLNKMRIAYCL